MKHAYAVGSALVALLSVLLDAGASSAVSQPLFESEVPLTIRLEAPFGALEHQLDEPEWLEGRLILSETGVADRVFEIEVKARGQFRRLSGECDFPTFWVNFKKSEVGGTVFENQDKLKVVSHCRERRSFYDRYLHREYLAYKTYNLLTEASFRVRLIQVEYVYTDRRSKESVRPAFLIEDDDQLARRLGGTIVENQIVMPEFLNPAAENLAEVFQYMIGNTDFDFTVGQDDCCHNGKVVAFASRDGTFIPVAYDFDMTGIVNPPYARVDRRMDIDEVTERRYRGLSTSGEVLATTIDTYRLRRDAILALWNGTSLLDERDRKEPVKFLEEFFEELDDPEAFTRKLISQSRSREGLSRLLEKKYTKAFEEWQTK